MDFQQRRNDDKHGAIAPEDEDLFDFPVMELTAEGLRERGPLCARNSLEVLVDLVDPALPHAPARETGSRISAPALPVAPRDPFTHELGAVAIEPASVEPHGRRRPASRRSWAVVALLLAVNALGLSLAWRTNASLRADVDDLRAQVAARSISAIERVPTPVSQADTPPPVGSIASPERDAITRAERELQVGEFATARRRLYRALAMVDRVSEPERDAIEPRATVLIGDSYRLEANALRGSKQ